MTAASDDHDETALAVLSLLSRKWHPRIVMALHDDSPLGFNELHDSLDGISGKVLSQNVESLREQGLISRAVVSESPLRVEYDVTEAGAELGQVFETLADWGDRHLNASTPEIVIADRDPRLTELYRQWLDPEAIVYGVHDETALREVLDHSIDIVVYDRQFVAAGPARVDELARIANDTCRTVLLTADRPGFDLVDLPCDAIVRKPVSKPTFLETIDTQLERYGQPPDERLADALRAKRAVLEAEHSAVAVERSDQYGQLCDRLEELSADTIDGDDE
ncbi:winged helix-turn-helix transcriptional regulator [Natronorubrum sp. DTA7]|uniref:winged helix-turn-helix transcriptional regulator n=1 Tax=Natronorubrum sp. DTA7 TaxID=3447016 RepID=UPI003F862475